MLLASVRFFFLLSILHTSSSRHHSSFIQGEKMPTSLGEKKPKQLQTNELSHQKKQDIKAQLGTAQNSFQPCHTVGADALRRADFRHQRVTCIPALNCIHPTLVRKYILFPSRFVSPPRAAPSHLTTPWSSLPVTHRSLGSHCSPSKSLIPGSETGVQFLRLLPPVSLTRGCVCDIQLNRRAGCC